MKVALLLKQVAIVTMFFGAILAYIPVDPVVNDERNSDQESACEHVTPPATLALR